MSAGGPPVGWDRLARDAAGARSGSDDVLALQQRLLTFALGGVPYALPVERVREIVRLRPVTSIPRVPADVLGAISLRGEIVQVIDLRLRLGLPATPPGPRARIIIVQGEDGRAGGLLVDAVEAVLSVDESSLQPATGEPTAVTALCARGERFVSLVDLDRVWDLHAGH